MKNFAMLVIGVALIVACTKEGEKAVEKVFEKLTAEQIKEIKDKVSALDTPEMGADEVAVIETKFGRMVIEFDIENAPLHSANFKKLAEAGYFDGTTFHRVMPGFMIQGGDINSRDTIPSNDGSGGPGYTLAAEIFNLHLRGTVAAARLGDGVNPQKRSSGSQFYICLGDKPHLDGEYTAFGNLIEGLDVMDKIATVVTGLGDRPIEDIVMQRVFIIDKSAL